MARQDSGFRFGKVQGGIILSLYPAFIVLTAPYVGSLRNIIWTEHREWYGPILNAVLYISVGFFFLYCIRTIRDRHLERYLCLVLIFIFMALGMKVLSTSMTWVNLIERIHLVEYGLLGIVAFGFFRNFSRRRIIHLWSVIFVFFVAICDEVLQHLLAIRTGEFRDVLINLLAGIASQLFILLVVRPEYMKGSPFRLSLSELFALLAVLSGMAGFFYYFVQGGYPVETAKGKFYSYHSPERLLEKDRKKREEGPEAMLRELEAQGGIWALEDFYLTEARQHANRRDFVVPSDLLRAYSENRILERYFSTYLDFTNSRWEAKRVKQYGRRLKFPPDFYFTSDVLDTLFVAMEKKQILRVTIICVIGFGSVAAGLRKRRQKKA